MSKIVELIFTTELRGEGVRKDDPVHTVPQLWTKDGRLVCELEGKREEVSGLWEVEPRVTETIRELGQ